MSDNISNLLRERGKVYGEFDDIARLAQELKEIMRTAPGWDKTPNDACESLDMIALKMARVICGDPDHIDNWDDISGYAELVANRIRGESL